MPARALDEHEVVIVGELRRGRGRGLGTDGRAPRPPRGRGRGQRLGVAGELAGGDAGDEARDLREIARLVRPDARSGRA